MDEFDQFFIIIGLLMFIPLYIIGIMAGGSILIGDNHSYTGYIVDTEYTTGGYGHSDKTVVYFSDRTIIVYGNVEINRNCNATLTWFTSTFPGADSNYKSFVSINYKED